MSLRNRWSNFSSSYQFKLFSIFTLSTFLVAFLLTTLYITSEIQKSRIAVTEQLSLLTKHLADIIRLPLYAENLEMLNYLAEQTAMEPQICAVVVTAPDNRVLAEIRIPGQSKPVDVISKTVEVHSSQMVDSIESSLAGNRDAATALIGSVRVERNTADLAYAVRQVVVISVTTAIIFWLLVLSLCYLVLRKVTSSFNALLHGINVMQQGDFNYRINIESDDEPGRAARDINDLATALQKRSEENSRLLEERLELERQMLQTQKLESLGIMAGGIAHDFNNLLQSMLGNMELASMKLSPDSEPHKLIAHSMYSARRAALLTNLMLTYVGKGLITKKELNLNELVMENAEMLHTAVSSAVKMELHLSTELPFILADEAHIQQVVMNLIINAAESIEERPGFVALATGIQDCDQTFLLGSLVEEKPEPGCFVFLEISDNGCGMSAETLKRLFDPFFTTKFTGRGLGMSAVMGIMKMHCGALFVESEPGKGTTFRALFPALETSAPAPHQIPVAPQSETGTFTENELSGVALVVDDEKSVLRICTKMVKLCGLTVITACDGVDAVDKFREHADEIDIVLMDLTMPNMDGIAAMGEIYNIRPSARVILSSGFNNDELSERITSQPPSGFIRKPYNMNELEIEIRRVLQTD